MKYIENARKLRPIIEQAVNSLDDVTASKAVEFHSEMRYDGKLIPAKTRINWKGCLKRAAVDLWDMEIYNPDNATSLWEDVSYRDGFRVIPEVFTATLAFAKDECGWWKDTLYRSRVDGNVYTPDVYPPNWELV